MLCCDKDIVEEILGTIAGGGAIEQSNNHDIDTCVYLHQL